MTVKEMHIDVRDQVQNLSTNRARKLQDDHIDWYLNRSQQMMIEAAVTPVQGSGRYQIKPGKFELISGLIVNRHSLSATWKGEKYMSLLPPDFWYLIDDGSKVSQLCAGNTKTIGYEILNITRVQFPLSQLGYANVTLTYNGGSVFNINTLLSQRQKVWTGFPAADAHFYIRELLIQELTKLGIKVYWERFDSFEYPFHLVFVYTGNSLPIVLTVDGVPYSGVNQELTTETHSNSGVSVLSPNTMISSDKEMATARTPFFKTSYISPISEKGNGVIHTHGDDSYIVYSTSINYVRKPAQISLSLGTNCELSAQVHQNICNQATEMVMNRIGDSNWKEVADQNKEISK